MDKLGRGSTSQSMAQLRKVKKQLGMATLNPHSQTILRSEDLFY